MSKYVDSPSGNGFASLFKGFSSRKGSKGPKKKSALSKLINGWIDRLLGAASDGSFSGQEEEYESHRTTHDYIWNTIGYTAWGMVFPILTIVVTQLTGAERAGMFSLAFVTASLLMILANFGVRTYQISDVEEKHSFADYCVQRWITCIAMVLVAFAYCNIRGYSGEMFTMCFAVCVYRAVDGLADVYEGRLQQKDKLYLAGISLGVRSLFCFAAFSVCLLITGDLGIASVVMAGVGILFFVVLTAPLALLETPKSRKPRLSSIVELFGQCAPLFIALFMYSLIDNMPKFMMEGMLSYDNQLYFNALYFPAQTILMMVGFIYKPLLVRMANAWADVKRRKMFDLFIVVIVVVIVAITGVAVFIMDWIGIPIMSFLYGVDFEPYRQLSYIMLVAGGVTGIIDFLYQVITVLRKQNVVMKLYVITFGFSLFVPWMMISVVGLPGAALGYMIVMSILAVLLVMEYVKVRIAYARNPQLDEEEARAAQQAAQAEAAQRAAAGRRSASAGGVGRHGSSGRGSVSGRHASPDRGAASGRHASSDRAIVAGRHGFSDQGSEPENQGAIMHRRPSESRIAELDAEDRERARRSLRARAHGAESDSRAKARASLRARKERAARREEEGGDGFEER
ncbi:MAG: lipopolysaccharide biosynthesis protein [Eggerthellaceae bacterium]